MKASLCEQAELVSLIGRVDAARFSGKSFLVTGATGMLGSYLVSALLGICRLQGLRPPRVTILVRDINSPNLYSFLNDQNVEIVVSELVAWESNTRFDYLIHAASPASPTKFGDGLEVQSANVDFVRKLKSKGLPDSSLFISSGEVYGSNAPKGVKEDFVNNTFSQNSRAIYPLAKLAGEQEFLTSDAGGVKRNFIARLFHTFGPGMRLDDGRSFADFIWSAARGQDIYLRGDGKDIRSFLYLEDAVAGLLTLLNLGLPGGIYNLGSDIPESVLSFAERVQRNAGTLIKVSANARVDHSYLASPNRTLVPSVEKLRGLGWDICVPEDLGIQRTVNWARTQLGNS